MTSATTDTALDVLKARLKATWMDGNYDYFSRFMASSATQLLDALPLSPGPPCSTWRAGRDSWRSPPPSVACR